MGWGRARGAGGVGDSRGGGGVGWGVERAGVVFGVGKSKGWGWGIVEVGESRGGGGVKENRGGDGRQQGWCGWWKAGESGKACRSKAGGSGWLGVGKHAAGIAVWRRVVWGLFDQLLVAGGAVSWWQGFGVDL